jgi:hypothetical protein
MIYLIVLAALLGGCASSSNWEGLGRATYNYCIDGLKTERERDLKCGRYLTQAEPTASVPVAIVTVMPTQLH